MSVRVINKFDEVPIKKEVTIIRTICSQMICLRQTKWQVIIIWIIRSDPKSNSSKSLWLPSLLASLMKIQSEMKSLLSWQHFKSTRPSRARNSSVSSRNRVKIKLVRDFNPVLVTCKFDNDSIKPEVAIVRTIFSPLYVNVWLKGK